MLGVSNSVRNDLRRDLRGWEAEKIQTLYNRIDVFTTQLSMLSKTEARKALNLPQSAWIVGSVGRLHHDKDHATLIRGFEKSLLQLPKNSLLVIVGKGPLEESLKRLVANLKLESNVIFTGNLPDAKRYFKAFDVFALTSDHEPFGMVLLEAMVAELPIICSDCGGGAEVVKNIGQLFSLGNSDELATQLVNTYQVDVQNHHQKQSWQDSNMQIELNRYFSDEAAKGYFWCLPFVKQCISN